MSTKSIATTIAALVVATALGGCSTGNPLDAGAETAADVQAVERTVRTYLVAGGEGNGRRACRQLSVQAREKWKAYVRRTAPDLEVDSCAEAFLRAAAARGAAHNTAAKAARTLTFASVEVDDDAATVQVVPKGRTLRLRKRGGAWRITGGLGI